jgi:hypothetical protein
MMQRKTLSVHLNKYMAGKNKKSKTTPKNKKQDKKQKAVTPLPSPPAAVAPLPVKQAPLEQPDPNVMKVIKDALVIQLTNPDSHYRKRSTANELEAMIATCQEFMKSFVILGYNFEGQPIPPMIIANTQQDADALGSYLSKFIHNTIKEQNSKDHEE